MRKGVDDKVERYKERMVAKGYSLKEGIEFHDIFSPFVKYVSIMMQEHHSKPTKHQPTLQLCIQ
jgi:hypothetical protein